MPARIGKAVEMLLGMLGVIALLVVLPALFIIGAEKISRVIWPYLEIVSIVAFAITILVFVPLSFTKRYRLFSAAAILITAHLFGLTLWVEALLVTSMLWGTVAVVVGLLLGGVGIIPVGMLACLFNAAWPQLIDLSVLAAVTLGFRRWGFRTAYKAEQDALTVSRSEPSLESAG